MNAAPCGHWRNIGGLPPCYLLRDCQSLLAYRNCAEQAQDYSEVAPPTTALIRQPVKE